MKTMRMKLVVLPALLLLVLISQGCSRRKNVFTNPNSPHVAGWLEGSSPNSHGFFVKRDGGPFVCAGCHTVSTTDSASFCFKCHYGPSGRPHPPAWTDSSKTDFHGVRTVNSGLNVEVNGRIRACQDCHYVDNQDTLSLCFRCHKGPTGAIPKGMPSIPGHRRAWGASGANPRSLIFHGKYVSSVGYEYCKACHGSNFQGGIGPSCGKAGCHTYGGGYTFFPHMPTWNDSSSANQGFHGKFVLQRGTPAVCQSCHGKDYSGGYSGKSCYSCHKYYPHPEQALWTDTLQDYSHGNELYRYGYDACKVCHGDTSTNFNGGRVNVSCLSCHTGSVHGFTGPSNRWKFGFGNVRWHGSQVGRDGFVACASCHGANYNYSRGGTGRGCASGCHGDPQWRQYGAMPHLLPEWPRGDTLPPPADTTHAWWVNVVQGRDTTNCNHCHFPTTHSWRDGRYVPSCQTCH